MIDERIQIKEHLCTRILSRKASQSANFAGLASLHRPYGNPRSKGWPSRWRE
ncbi:hypothetical protein MPTK1_3g21240 [Marchantia polymorpha subsp. ruderalis]|uniref:Uncharacterized protein n=2 Tax=Marchantia polymorpha TaxID=3197 RepID=A0AAF6B363_MARPO|nr:hypothetical protein MARPO_0160s0019 [Marchantia polymorpha]BBN06447.1 hypothetical protein Mp_3g21240 [Marchantia polymorpha subsp. ruderalis]|eukprot:PTQ28567.1 hypothetical protein MARPO_0160s0019 [Marchantia polymorpha]